MIDQRFEDWWTRNPARAELNPVAKEVARTVWCAAQNDLVSQLRSRPVLFDQALQEHAPVGGEDDTIPLAQPRVNRHGHRRIQGGQTMTYEVQFQSGGTDYTVRAETIEDMLVLIQRVQALTKPTDNGWVEWHEGEQWAPPIGPPPAWVNEPKDPHAELRKTWAPGQRWQTRVKGSTDWLHLRDDPCWHSDQEYRQCE